jgi:tRNA G37 N-methylase TrmD
MGTVRLHVCTMRTVRWLMCTLGTGKLCTEDCQEMSSYNGDCLETDVYHRDRQESGGRFARCVLSGSQQCIQEVSNDNKKSAMQSRRSAMQTRS